MSANSSAKSFAADQQSIETTRRVAASGARLIDSRAKLAAQQSALMQALTSQTSLAGFDAQRLEATAISLQQKRMRSVEHSHPCIASALGSDFAELFAVYAQFQPIPAAGPSTDALQFTEYLAQRDLLPNRMWRGYFLTKGWQNRRTWWQLLRRFKVKAKTFCTTTPINPIPRRLH